MFVQPGGQPSATALHNHVKQRYSVEISRPNNRVSISHHLEIAVYELFFLESRVSSFIGCLSTVSSRNETLRTQVPREREILGNCVARYTLGFMEVLNNVVSAGCERMNITKDSKLRCFNKFHILRLFPKNKTIPWWACCKGVGAPSSQLIILPIKFPDL